MKPILDRRCSPGRVFGVTNRPGSVDARLHPPDQKRAEAAITAFLEALGLDPSHPALAESPRRATEAFLNVLTAGYQQTPADALGRGFPVQGPGAVIATQIPLMFVCPHHLLPARGQAHLAFLPHERAPGLSRLTRLVDVLGRRLVLQEDLGEGLVEALIAYGAKAAIAIIEARHTCVAVEDFARAETLFCTRAARGPDTLLTSLAAELNVSLGRPWTASSSPIIPKPASKSPSRSAPTSSAKPKKRTSSAKRPRSR